jgi:hypothetical protein
MKKISKRQVLLFVGLCSLLLCTSCDDRVTAEFTITNSTLRRIDSLSIEPNQNLTGKYIHLDPNETVEYKIDMTGIAQVDGSYLLTYQSNGLHLLERFGYYTNGHPLESTTDIEIQIDSVYIVQNFGVY